MASEKQNFHVNDVLPSTKYPIYLRALRPGDVKQHAVLCEMKEEDSAEAITFLNEHSAKPTTYSSESNKVLSGPNRVNMVICESAAGDAATVSDENDRVIGLGGYGAIKDWERDGKAIRAGDVGVALLEEVRRKGYAVEAMRLSIDWAFRAAAEGGPQLDLITITTAEDNEPMIRLVEDKMKITGGILRPAEFDKTKQEKYWEVTPEEWAKLRG